MIVDDAQTTKEDRPKREKRQNVKIIRKKREPRKYVSKHFTQAKSVSSTPRAKRRKKEEEYAVADRTQQDESSLASENLETAPTPVSSSSSTAIEDDKQPPRIYYGLNVDDLSSDSDLTEVPDDIGPDPFLLSASGSLKSDQQKKTKKKKQHQQVSTGSKLKRHKSATISPYFPSVTHAHRTHFLASLPFPPLSNRTFGLMQERLAHSPFRLLIATIFLNKTPGMRAMPVFYDLMAQYPAPEDLAKARVEDITEIIRMLGFQNQRARKIVNMAQTWVRCPPVKGKRYRKLNYPSKGDGRDVKDEEAVDDDDERMAWEISHLPGLGPYSHDSWRMFCRDELRGMADDWLGTEATNEPFEPEWKRVLPTDKELRAWMTWMWLKEGRVWNKETGKLTDASDDLMKLAMEGGVVQEPKDQDHLIVKALDNAVALGQVPVEKPAGDFIPSI